MAHFEKELWIKIAPRFKELRGEKNVEDFLEDNDLSGLKWRAMEDGRQGVSVESLAKICEKRKVSASWLLLGEGPKFMPSRQETIEEVVKQLLELINGMSTPVDGRKLKSRIYAYAEAIADLFHAQPKTSNVPKEDESPSGKVTTRVVSFDRGRSRAGGGGNKGKS